MTAELTNATVLRIHLPTDVITKANRELTDLLVVDDQGHETPFVLYQENAGSAPPIPFYFKLLPAAEQDAGA